jgi:hypothetical protein
LAERRAYIRYPRRLEVLWQLLGLARDLTTARVFDLSAAGIGMVSDRYFPPETLLLVRLPTPTRGWASHLVRVKHSRALGANEFQSGCAFVRTLTDEEMKALLR